MSSNIMPTRICLIFILLAVSLSAGFKQEAPPPDAAEVKALMRGTLSNIHRCAIKGDTSGLLQLWDKKTVKKNMVTPEKLLDIIKPLGGPTNDISPYLAVDPVYIEGCRIEAGHLFLSGFYSGQETEPNLLIFKFAWNRDKRSGEWRLLYFDIEIQSDYRFPAARDIKNMVRKTVKEQYQRDNGKELDHNLVLITRVPVFDDRDILTVRGRIDNKPAENFTVRLEVVDRKMLTESVEIE